MVCSQIKFREIVFQLLFGESQNPGQSIKQNFSMMDQYIVSRKTLYRAEEQAFSIISHLEEIDNIITMYSNNYDLSRITLVEKTVLRLAIYEIIYESLIPPKVSISEAIRINSRYGAVSGSTFVNGILDSFCQSRSYICPSKIESKLINH